jgi:aminopeptidase N
MQDLAALTTAARLGDRLVVHDDLLTALRRVVMDEVSDPALIALMLTLPTEIYLADQQAEIDPDAIHTARTFLKHAIARGLRGELKAAYKRLETPGAYRFAAVDIARRFLRNTALSYLLTLNEVAFTTMALNQCRDANNMTDAQAALTALVENEAGDAPLAEFAQRWANDPLVMDKWFALQASSSRLGQLAHIQHLMTHPAFQLSNPNKVRALLGSFVHQNLLGFHQANGCAYDFLANRVLDIDSVNPQLAARLVSGFNRWRRLEPGRRTKMQQALLRIANHSPLSPDVFEIVSKSLQ